MLAKINPNHIQDLEEAKQAIKVVLNVVEEVKQENERLRAANQKLRDEINRLKKEQGKPNIKASRKKGQPTNHSSEKERRQKRKWTKGRKRDKLKVAREELLYVDKSQLPADAVFKGYEEVVVQELRFETDNVRFRKEKYYSPSERRTWLAPLPQGYEGEFGPHVRSMVITLYYGANMSEPKIIELLSYIGLRISKGQVSNILTKQHETWHAEKDALYRAGLESSCWQHIDETGTRVDGENQYCHIMGNPLYTAYFTRPRKDRLTVIALLQNLIEGQCLFNNDTHQRLESIPYWARSLMSLYWPQSEWLTYKQVEQRIESRLDSLGQMHKTHLLEAGALTAYHTQTTMPLLEVLMSDDALQFKGLSKEHALCWIHDGRHYKKLMPYVAYHQKILADFLGQYWDYYAKLEQYRASPNDRDGEQLRQEFDTLFSTVTEYAPLNRRIAKTKAKKEPLLMVLKYPQMPLHNNPAELGARQRVRKRDVSFGPRTTEGVEAWDTFMTLAETAKKLGVSFYAYIHDRVSERYQWPSLAEIIRQSGPVFHPVRTPSPP